MVLWKAMLFCPLPLLQLVGPMVLGSSYPPLPTPSQSLSTSLLKTHPNGHSSLSTLPWAEPGTSSVCSHTILPHRTLITKNHTKGILQLFLYLILYYLDRWASTVPVTWQAVKKYRKNERMSKRTNKRTKIVESVKADEITKGDDGEDRTLKQCPAFVGRKEEASEENRMNNQRSRKKTSRIIQWSNPKEEKTLRRCRGSTASNTTSRSKKVSTKTGQWCWGRLGDLDVTAPESAPAPLPSAPRPPSSATVWGHSRLAEESRVEHLPVLISFFHY